MSDESSANDVLVIDDDPSLQTLVGMLLDRAGLRVTGAGTAIDGIQLLHQQAFGLLILDLMLPDMDGLELLKTLRQDGRFDKLPVLILSARADSEAISKALKSGADGYLTKPYLPLSLTQRVTDMLNQGRVQTTSFRTG